jgi:DNA-binding transcriptional MerR regulator
MLDYWIAQKLVTPHVELTKKRKFFFFIYEDVVRIRVIKSLRDAGLPLQRIRRALKLLRSTESEGWKQSWLVTDGRDVYTPSSTPEAIKCLSSGSPDQLVFSFVAMDQLKESVLKDLDCLEAADHTLYRKNRKSGS